jgi:hypothetical protein
MSNEMDNNKELLLFPFLEEKAHLHPVLSTGRTRGSLRRR